MFTEGWVIDFYLVETIEKDGKVIETFGEKIETVEIERAYAPTRWANTHAFSLRRKYQGAKVSYNIEKVG